MFIFTGVIMRPCFNLPSLSYMRPDAYDNFLVAELKNLHFLSSAHLPGITFYLLVKGCVCSQFAFDQFGQSELVLSPFCHTYSFGGTWKTGICF